MIDMDEKESMAKKIGSILDSDCISPQQKADKILDLAIEKK